MSSNERQRVQRVPGARRARLTPAPGTTAEPVPADEPDEFGASGPAHTPPGAAATGAVPSGPAASGPNDERLRRDVPPHY